MAERIKPVRVLADDNRQVRKGFDFSSSKPRASE